MPLAPAGFHSLYRLLSTYTMEMREGWCDGWLAGWLGLDLADGWMDGWMAYTEGARGRTSKKKQERGGGWDRPSRTVLLVPGL